MTADPFRPAFHLTAPSGWMNDPHGITYADGQYHVFYQHNPHAPAWSPRCYWAHARTTDFLHWHHEPPALEPGPDEGCWSGCVLDGDEPTIFYTLARTEEPWSEKILSASGDRSFARWTRRAEPLIPGPPAGFQTLGFRDPFVWRENGGWKMLVGTGIAETGGGVFRFASHDLEAWSFDGLLLAQPIGGGNEIWECPQWVDFDGVATLVFSLWRDEALMSVHYLTGHPDESGARFVPGRHGLLDHGTEFYAATVFADESGAPLVAGWCWEARDERSVEQQQTWAGTMSIPRRLHRRADGSIGVGPLLRPDAPPFRAAASTELRLHGGLGSIAVPGGSCAIELTVRGHGSRAGVRLVEADSRVAHLEIALGIDRDEITTTVLPGVSRGRRRQTVNTLAGVETADVERKLVIFYDRSIVELFVDTGDSFTHRIYPTPESELCLEAFADGRSALDATIDISTFEPEG